MSNTRIRRAKRRAGKNLRKCVRAENRRKRRTCDNCGEKRLYHKYRWVGLNPRLTCGIRSYSGNWVPKRKLAEGYRRRPVAFRG
jgi:hypothetical protein